MSPTWRIRDRATFAELRRSGRRGRSGPLSLTWLGEAVGDRPPQVAYAIGRPVGPAVVRNRLRRRLRAAVADLAQDMAPGTYLIAASPRAAQASFTELCTSLVAVLRSTTDAFLSLPGIVGPSGAVSSAPRRR
ncbi:MAG: ribonuclease P protein component [Acidimicrobiales bacterium]